MGPIDEFMTGDPPKPDFEKGFLLGHLVAPLNLNEKQLVDSLLDRVLGESIEVELLAGDSQLESESIFMLLESLKVSHIIAWRKLKGRRNPPEVLWLRPSVSLCLFQMKKINGV